MKIFSFAVLLFIGLISCNVTNESKARKLIEEKLKVEMNDWNSYEFVDMTCDSLFGCAGYLSNDEYKFTSRDMCHEAIYSDSIREAMTFERYNDSTAFVRLQELKKMKGVIDHIGWRSHFVFRGSNKFGVRTISSLTVDFDKVLTKIENYAEND